MTLLTELQTKFEQDIDLVHQVVHGLPTQDVAVENGSIPSLAKAIDGVINGLNTSSATPNTLSVGSKTFEVQAGKRFQADQLLTVTSLQGRLIGHVISYAGTTLVFNALKAEGTGNASDWLIALGSTMGEQGAAGPSGLNGEDGAQGENGINGEDGVDGLSAYELAVSQGFVGNLTEWLAFLQGADGAPGDISTVDTDSVAEGVANFYFTENRVRETLLTGLSVAAGTVVQATHSVLQAIGFLQKQVSDNAAAIGNKAASGNITASGLTQATTKLLGRGTAGTGAVEEITLGTGLSMSGTTLDAANTPLTTAQNYAPTVTVGTGNTTTGVVMTNISDAESNVVIVQTTASYTNIFNLGIAPAGAMRIVTFAGINNLLHSPPNLSLPGSVTIVTAAGDTALFISLGAGNWRCAIYQKASGAPIQPLSYLVETINKTTPNAAIPAVQLKSPASVMSGYTGIDLVLAPGGNGALLGRLPNNATSGGNKRGAYAVDWQIYPNDASQVASGDYAVISGGLRNTSSGLYSVVGGGDGNTSSHQYTFVGGGNWNASTNLHATVPGGIWNLANGVASMVAGRYGSARGITGANVWGAGAGTTGSHQTVQYILRKDTTNSTPAILTADAGNPASTNTVCLPNNSSYRLSVKIIVRNTGAGAQQSKCWTTNVLIHRGASAATTALVGTPAIVSEFGSVELDAASVAVSANITLGCFEVTVTGVAATNLRWEAIVQALEITN